MYVETVKVQAQQEWQTAGRDGVLCNTVLRTLGRGHAMLQSICWLGNKADRFALFVSTFDH